MERFARSITVILFVLGTIIQGYSQKSFRLGVEYAPSSSIYTGSLLSTERLLVHSFNLLLTHPLSQEFDLEIGFGYRTVGDKHVSNGRDKVITKYESKWIAMPIGIRYKVKKFFLTPRIYYSRNISHTLTQQAFMDGEKIFDKTTQQTSNNQVTYKEDLFGVQLQLGYQFDLHGHYFHTGIYYDRSITAINEDTPLSVKYNTIGIFFSAYL